MRVVVPRGVVAAQLDLQAPQAVGADPVAQQHRIAVVAARRRSGRRARADRARRRGARRAAVLRAAAGSAAGAWPAKARSSSKKCARSVLRKSSPSVSKTGRRGAGRRHRRSPDRTANGRRARRGAASARSGRIGLLEQRVQAVALKRIADLHRVAVSPKSDDAHGRAAAQNSCMRRTAPPTKARTATPTRRSAASRPSPPRYGPGDLPRGPGRGPW